jgi:predicted transcriptional regulator
MSLFPFDITSISLIISIVSFVIVFGLLVFVMRMKAAPREGSDDSNVDVLAIVQEFRERNQAFEERLVDLRVRLEILDLRVAKLTGGDSKRTASQSYEIPVAREEPIRRSSLSPISLSKRDMDVAAEVDPIRRQILSAVKEANGVATSADIQKKIGRSREHVARTMNQLQKQGLLSRNLDSRPFSYSITQEGENQLRRAG